MRLSLLKHLPLLFLLSVSLIQLSGVAVAQTTEADRINEAGETGETEALNELPPFVNINKALPAHHPVPGGIAIVPLNISDLQKPLARFGSRKILVVPYRNEWHGVVGLPCDILPGNYIVSTVDSEDETGKVPMRVVTLPPPQPDSETDTTAPGLSVPRSAGPITLPEAVASSAFINGAMRIPADILTLESELPAVFEFAPVVESRTLIPYGKILRQNKIETHDYLGYLAEPDAQVYAPAPGVVIKVVEGANSNGLVYLDHGGGIVSLLGNLEKILVQEGQVLDRGEQLGRAGADGSLDQSRVDFGISVNGFLVDPLQFPSTS